MRSNKKGFTIVELVIVIAVIAILAAVLIPTIAGLVKKANVSADQQAVVQMNKLLAINEKAPANTDEVVQILIKNGYSDDLSTYYAGHSLAWVKAENTIVLVEEGKVVYPEKLAGAAFEEIKATIANDIKDVVLTDGKVVFVGSDIEAADGLATEAAGEYKVNLNGNVLSAGDYIGSWVDDGKLVISNGTINSTNKSIAVYADEGGVVELNNVQVYAINGANPLQCYGGTMILTNVTAAQTGEADTPWYNSVIQVVNNIEQVNGKWTLYGEQANLTVNSGIYTGKKAIQISAPGGNVTINGGSFTGTEYVINADFAPQNYGNSEGYESVITINGGTFTGNLKFSKATELVINGGDFTMAKITYFSTEANKNVTVDATWDVLSAFVADGATIVLNGTSYTK